MSFQSSALTTGYRFPLLLGCLLAQSWAQANNPSLWASILRDSTPMGFIQDAKGTNFSEFSHLDMLPFSLGSSPHPAQSSSFERGMGGSKGQGRSKTRCKGKCQSKNKAEWPCTASEGQSSHQTQPLHLLPITRTTTWPLFKSLLPQQFGW